MPELGKEKKREEGIILTLYGRDGCPMCIEGKSWLESEGIHYLFREIFKEPLTRKELFQLAEKLPGGFFDLYAPKGARKAGLPENPKSFTSEQILQFQMTNPDLVRYPVFDLGNQLAFGFKESTKPLLLAALRGPGR